MYAILSANNREEVFVVPYIPPDISIGEGQAVDEYDGLSVHVTMPGNMKPRTVSWKALYPRSRQAFSAPGCGTDPEAFVDFLRRWRTKHYPLRFIIMDGEKAVLNMAVLVDTFSYAYTKSTAMDYSISLIEYRFI